MTQKPQFDALDMALWLLARRSFLGSHREAASSCFGQLGTDNWDNYTKLAEYFADIARKEKQG